MEIFSHGINHMRFYRLLSELFGQETTYCDERFEPGDARKACKRLAKLIPEAGEIISFSSEEEIIKDNKKIAEIITKRKPVIQKFRSLSVGSPNYLPFSFLQRALRCCAAVCLIKQNYQIKDIIERIENTSIKAIPSVIDVISDELGLRDKFWEEYDTVSEAIEDEHFQNKIETKEENTVWVPLGTGFLVCRNYLLTSHHVLPNKEEAESYVVQFKYEKDEFGRDRTPIEYHLDTSFFKTSPESKLDYTIVKLHPFSFDISTELANLNDEDIENKKEDNRKEFNPAFEEAGDNFGWLQMLKDDDLISPSMNLKKPEDLEILKYLPKKLQARANLLDGFAGESVNIIQHPRGRQKEIVISDNKVQSIYKNFIEYTTDADFGSSGSPVFNNRWQLVALHHAMLVEYKDDVEKSLEKNVIVRGNLGVRINQIVADLEQKGGAEDFLKEFVNQPPRRTRKIFILAGRERKRFGDDKTKEAELTDNIGKKIGELLEDSQKIKELLKELSSTNQLITENYNYNFQPEYVPKENKETLDNAIDWIKQETDSHVIENNYQLGDVAIEIVTNYCYKYKNSNNDYLTPDDPTPDKVRGATIYYVNLPNFKGEQKIHAETL